MLYNGCFNAAKRVALALDSLIRGKYPRDHLSIIGFSYLAQEIKPGDLPTIVNSGAATAEAQWCQRTPPVIRAAFLPTTQIRIITVIRKAIN